MRIDPAQQSQTEQDAALVGRMAAGDALALRQFYDRHSSIAYGLCLRILGNASEAEEVLVDVFHEFWRRAETFDAARGSPLGLLVTLARSRAIDRRRRTKKDPRALAIQPSDATDRPENRPDAVLDQQQERDRIRGALKSLQPEQRRAIEAAYYDGMSHSEIASAMDKPLGTVKTYIRQGLIRLREMLGGAASTT
jgi:RNA polymerase sigma-70 factor (ECF subfamily)